MARPTTWKEVHIYESRHWARLDSYYQSSKGEFGRYLISWEEGAGVIETNMPWSLFRAWFSFSGVPMPSDVLVCDKPSWEIYGEAGDPEPPKSGRWMR